MEENKKKKSLLILGSICLIIILLGSAYAFFTYFKSHEAFAITSLNVRAEFTSGTNSVNFTNAYPISDEFAKENLDKLTYIDFTVTSEIESIEQAVEYEIYLEEDEGNTLDSSFIKVYLTDDNNKQVVNPKIYSSLENTSFSDSANGKVIYKENNTGAVSKNYRLYVWLDDSYEQNEVSQSFKFKVNLYATNEKPVFAVDIFKSVLTTRINSYIQDTDGTIYISGKKDDYNSETTDDIDFNYVWYSGKLWRITAIYPDETMMMITEDLITSISWGEPRSSYENSWLKEWLNQEFLPTLSNYETIIVTDSVKTMNSDEYSKSYEKLGTDSEAYGSGYLNVGYGWWISSRALVEEDGRFVYITGNLPFMMFNGVRPSLDIKSNIKFIGGEGSYDNPYVLKDSNEVVNNVTLLNTRASGEYVEIENDSDSSRKFRIVDEELIGGKLTTKLVLNDYIKENDIVVTKYFSNDYTYGDGDNDTYWDYYLNDTYLKTLDTSILEKGTYYLGLYDNEIHYKATVCSIVDSTKSTSTCINEGNVVDTTWTGYVGLLRAGEMFSSQIKRYPSSDISSMWLITPSSSSNVRYTSFDGTSYNASPSSKLYAARPTINLTSTVVIKSGSGTEQDPFVVGLPA